MGSAPLAAAAFGGLSAPRATREGTHRQKATIQVTLRQQNKPLLDENPNSNMPPPTDNGDAVPIWSDQI